MPKGNGGTNWGIIFAGSAVGLTIVLNGIGWLTSGTDKLEKRVSQLENDLAWKYTSKELLAKDIAWIRADIIDLKNGKTEKDIFEAYVKRDDTRFSWLIGKVTELDHSINQSFNVRDAFSAFQTRLLELERATRKLP